MIFIIYATIQALRNYGNSGFYIKKCDTIDDVFVGLIFITCLMHYVYGVFYVKREYKVKKEINYEFEQGDFKPTSYNVFIVSLSCFWLSIVSSWTGLSPVLTFIP